MTLLRLSSLLLPLLLSLSLVPNAAAVKPLSEYQSGILTHYGGAQDNMDPNNPSYGSQEGACGYGAIPKDRWPYFSVAALSPSNKFYKEGPLNGCGQCFQIECVGGMDDFHKDACIKDSKGLPKSIKVMISDKCPECEADHLDVQSLSFAKLVDPGIGRIQIKYRRIECTPPDDLKVSVMDFVGSNGWLRLSVDDTGGRGAVENVHVKGSSSGSWIPMTNTWGAAWELGNAPAPPLDFKITCDDGEEVVATDVIKQNGGISVGAFGNKVKFQTGVQFTITDPSVQRVQAASGPTDGSGNDLMVVTSDTPGNDGSLPTGSTSPPPSAPSNGNKSSNNSSSVPPSSSGSGSQSCSDVPPPGAAPCATWKDWNKCSDQWLVTNSYCAATCDRCNGASSGQGAGSTEPQVQSFSGPSNGGSRKLLARST